MGKKFTNKFFFHFLRKKKSKKSIYENKMENWLLRVLLGFIFLVKKTFEKKKFIQHYWGEKKGSIKKRKNIQRQKIINATERNVRRKKNADIKWKKGGKK